MKNVLFIGLFAILLLACESDETKMRDFAGIYEVTLEAPGAGKDLKKAEKKVEKELDAARDQIQKDIADAKEDLAAEFDEENKFGEAIGNFMEGMGKFAEGMTHLAESMGKLGIGLGNGVLGNIRFYAEFNSDGSINVGKNTRKLSIASGEELSWEIKDGKFFLLNNEGNQAPKKFEMKKISEDEWDLVGEEVIFHLKKAE